MKNMEVDELFGSPKIFFRRFIKAYMKLWLEKNAKGELNLQKAKSPLDAITEYIARLDKIGIHIEAIERKLRENGVFDYRFQYSRDNQNCKILIAKLQEFL